MSKIDNLRADIAIVLNRYSVESASNTPDFILAEYLTTCLAAFDIAVRRREAWYGRETLPAALVNAPNPETPQP